MQFRKSLLVINELEASYVRKMFTAAQNHEGYNLVIEEMQKAGIVGKRGKPIGRSQITEILHNEKYTGVYLYCPVEEKKRSDRRSKPNAIRIEDALPAIVSKEQFQEVQRIMQGRKQTGNRHHYLCSGLVYCSCGAKMHAMSPSKNGLTYHYYVCSQKCGATNVRMEDVDNAAKAYLKELLSDRNQLLIEDALRAYIKGNSSRQEDFKAAVKQKITAKQKEYDALLHNLSCAALPPTVVVDIGKKMEKLQEEIETLKTAEPPTDYTAETVRGWLQEIRTSPNDKAVHLLIERIDVIPEEDKAKTAFCIHSTLKAVLGKCGCGDRT